MTLVSRILPSDPVESLDRHLAAGGGAGLAAALGADPAWVVDQITAAGLRGRGGAGFPTGTKWAAVRENLSSSIPATVVVNAAEGEPGTFKDRMLLRRDPYSVVEGALIAAHVVGARRVILAVKEGFARETARLHDVIAELVDARWCDDVEIEVFAGPKAYLLGEETALLEAIDGRPPFPRIAPPFRRGVDEVVETPADVDSGSGLSAHVEMAGGGGAVEAPPALVDNVETLANVAFILREGVDAFRSMGTEQSPGTVICTVTGSVATPDVAEVEMGTLLSEVLEAIGGGPLEDRRLVAVLPGVSNAVIVAERFDTPLTYEDMEAAGSGLGSASFVVFDDSDDMLAVAAGVSRFLYVESCGQCTPCKKDGGVISQALDQLVHGEFDDAAAPAAAVVTIRGKLDTVADGARCALARQHEAVIRSLLDAFPDTVTAHVDRTVPAAERTLVGDLVDLHDGIMLVDEELLHRQPDWTDDPVDSGATPVERFIDHRAGV
ncbi:MAG: NADH-ubiquinone oxidoreductase-F iron-sulfur binding region domain-containing protein [Acidimicrobiales bacterium]